MIDPLNITNHDRTTEELQQFAIFAVCVAGKRAEQIATKLSKLLQQCPEDRLPLDYLTDGHILHNMLVANRIGQYDRIERAIRGLARINLKTCSLEDLVSIPGIGWKTAILFLLHSRRDFTIACLDTHALEYLRYKGHKNVPESSPSDREVYMHWSAIIVRHYRADFGHKLPLADIDLLVWKMMSGRS